MIKQAQDRACTIITRSSHSAHSKLKILSTSSRWRRSSAPLFVAISHPSRQTLPSI